VELDEHPHVRRDEAGDDQRLTETVREGLV
jgi:hypothetical protein